MGSVTIRGLDDAIKHNARIAAARNGRSLESELRALLEEIYGTSQTFGQNARKLGEGRIDYLLRIAPDVDPFELPNRSRLKDSEF